jgi:hypothetical protein
MLMKTSRKKYLNDFEIFTSPFVKYFLHANIFLGGVKKKFNNPFYVFLSSIPYYGIMFNIFKFMVVIIIVTKRD